MVYVGRKNRLRVVKTVAFGVYLDGGESGEILLPRRDVPDGCKPGDWLHVFIYNDSDDRLIATRETPAAMVGECAYLMVRQQNDVGTFLDWGLSKDLLVPFNEQAWPMHQGRSYVVCVYLDEDTKRIAASTKYSRHLSEDGSGFTPGDEVKLMIAATTELGYKAVINNSHLGLIFKADVFQPLKFGQQLRGYIKTIRDDGKIDLALQPASAEVVDQLEGAILDYMRRHDGVSRITDKSPPDLIYKTFKASKANYKRALGRLYKKRRISIEKYQIVLV
ncbi:MAG: GntR family transcriptional regulator [Gammaproteobacteria bacterium]|nr:GntR family transcriptional regulator [Gammaproteobacteria bacterium]